MDVEENLQIKEENVCLLFAWKLNNIATGTDVFR